MRAIQLEQFGGPEVLDLAEIDSPTAGPHQALVDVRLAGINFRDINLRSGSRKVGLPLVLGSDGVGTIKELGGDPGEFSIGDRVAWKAAPRSYAEQVAVDTDQLVPVPDDISDEVAAAALLQGLTAHYLACSAFSINPNVTALVHAAAGGVGLMLTQMIRLQGGNVIGTVSSPSKESLARGAGAAHVIRYDEVEVAPAIEALTDGKGVDVVYDGIGRTTFEGSLASLRSRGMLLLYGTASGEVPPFNLSKLGARSLGIECPSLPSYTQTREELLSRSSDLFEWIRSEKVRVHIGGVFPMQDVQSAHRSLETRQSTGKLLLQIS